MHLASLISETIALLETLGQTASIFEFLLSLHIVIR